MEGTVIKLSKPISAHGETIAQLSLSEPTLAILDDVELFSVKGDGSIKINFGDLHKIIAGMADIPPSAAKNIALQDLKQLIPMVTDFFGVPPPIGGN